MVKFGKSKLKTLNKLAKKQNVVNTTATVSNKILKKKVNADRRVTFQKEVLFKEAVSDNSLVKNVTKKDLLLDELLKKISKPQNTKKMVEAVHKPKLKPVKKQKQRQKIQIDDTKLLLNLIKKK
ncbi:unnamed protein product [Diatraea saccharalis]|uniref:Uncharacterized protein n=1 Tax=Diatraea saccharalis TaxID=40085 RepID=A0A9N9RDP3_9NEOP|nr:unnamed protein product [Diatraea saccharalis]